MSNTMTAHEPINYLDSILNEEEKRCEYSHQWRNFTISRSGRFKSKNVKKRDVVDGKLFDAVSTTSTAAVSQSATTTSAAATMSKETTMTGNGRYTNGKQEKYTAFQSSTSGKSKYATPMGTNSRDKERGKCESYKSFYETNF